MQKIQDKIVVSRWYLVVSKEREIQMQKIQDKIVVSRWYLVPIEENRIKKPEVRSQNIITVECIIYKKYSNA